MGDIVDGLEKASQWDEWKAEKPEWKDAQKDELKDNGPPEKPLQIEAPFPDQDLVTIPALPLAFDRSVLLAHAEALEQTAAQLRHFIAQAERPDLRRGALGNEPDQQEG